MDKITLKALHGSIRKWIKIATWEGYDSGSENCPLCGQFFGSDCDGCPVAIKTGQKGCYGSPYEEWRRAFIFTDYLADIDDMSNDFVFDLASQLAAEKMALFLIGLLPEKECSRYYEDVK